MSKPRVLKRLSRLCQCWCHRLRETMSHQSDKLASQSATTDMTREDWVKFWEIGRIEFHRTSRNELLVAHLDDLLIGRESIRIFVPLCGKAVDMKWFYDLGHTVVGVEGAQKGVEDFFKESDIQYTVQAADSVKGQLYQSLDKRLSIYHCDFYDFNSSVEGSFDAIWDRGAFGAINKGDRIRYANIIKSMMAPECRYLMEAFHYDETKFSGPPRHVSEQDLQQCFGDKCDIKQLDTLDNNTPGKPSPSGLVKFDIRLWLLVVKQAHDF